MLRITVTLNGTTPLLMHNSQLSSPLNPVAKHLKSLTSKRTKTEEDLLAIARVEWEGGLYYDPDTGPYMPTENIRACLIKTAGLSRKGPLIKRGLTATALQFPLEYDGPRDLDKLWGDGVGYSPFVDLRSAVNPSTRNRTDRCRPIFPEWSVSSEWILDPEQIDLDVFTEFATKAGEVMGIGDYRLIYGRFSAEVIPHADE